MNLDALQEIPRNLILILLASFLMRACFYLSLAILNHPEYLPESSGFMQAIVFVAYPAAELVTVSFFGVLSDRIGRRPVFFGSYMITAIAVVLISTTKNIFILPFFTAVFGIGAAAKVSSTLAMVADESTTTDRGRNMGLYDASTLTGLGTGFGGGFLLMEFFPQFASSYFLVGAVVLVITMIISYPLIQESRGKASVESFEDIKHGGFLEMIGDVLKDPDMKRLLPIWVPVICLYGIVLSFAEDLAHELNIQDISLIIVLGIVFGAILVGFPLQGILSDRFGRRPFLYIGMVSFAAFVTLLALAKDSPENLILVSPLLFVIGIGCGAFPPAALALLADISHSDKYGTSMGAYSVVYGTGLIIGPLGAGVALELAQVPGLIGLIWILALISVYGTWKLPPHLGRKKDRVQN